MEKVHAEFFSIIMKVLKDTPYLDIDSFLIYFEMKINNLFCEMRSIILKFPLFCLDVSWRSSDKYWYREANIDDKFRQAAKIWIAYNSYRMHSLKVSLTFWISTRLECFQIMHINGSSKGAFLTFFFFFFCQISRENWRKHTWCSLYPGCCRCWFASIIIGNFFFMLLLSISFWFCFVKIC